uniref:Methyltransferase domain-containing protein n=1 Tax=Percolomonas cosmopolitus TaxID=63605 RepID=A0A7S1PHF0_9EUKA|mmetsp:Transcript_1582/g.5460  ORF Transcript_1582/g.5460 Transcript_1582/m.5460 type:complete len:359 (+) Transcript_1582:2-1078(+)
MSSQDYTKLFYDLPQKDPFTDKLLSLCDCPTKQHTELSPYSRPYQFIALTPDGQLHSFLTKQSKPSLLRQFYKSTLMKIFRYNLTSANAMSDCGEMFVMSEKGWRSILERGCMVDDETHQWVRWMLREMDKDNEDTPQSQCDDTQMEGSPRESHDADHPWIWIDCGSGDGSVLSRFLPQHILSNNLIAIEVNPHMIQKLKSKRSIHKVLHFDDDLHGELSNVTNHVKMASNRIVSLFNVLDRCYRPIQLLKDIHNLISQNNQFFIFSVVFPFGPFVENADGSQDRPEEYLMPRFASFSHSAHYLLTVCLKDFEVLCWSRVPYCCQGDLYQDYYALDSMVVCCRSRRRVGNGGEQSDDT